MKYTKPPLKFEKQIELLESRGLIVPDKKRALHYLSNIVAHHGRVWNRKLTMRPMLLKFVPKGYVWLPSNDIASNKLYAFCACLMYLKRVINPGTVFGNRLKELIQKYPIVDATQMGFPENWEKEDLWKTGKTHQRTGEAGGI